MPLPLSYNWRNLFVRKLSTTLTFVVVAVVVFVLSVLLSFAAGIRASLAASGSENNVLVLKPGSTAESTSIIGPEESKKLYQAPGIARDAQGRLLVSHELCVQTSIARRGPEGNMANVAVRGVSDMAFLLHDQVRLVQGRRFHEGADEILVGQGAHDRYQNLRLGDRIAIGRLSSRLCEVVGVFSSGGSALESEIWAPLTLLYDAYGRRFTSSALIRLENPAAAATTIDYINGPAVQLEAKLEPVYYSDLSRTTRELVILTTILVSIMAVGAMFAVANTMYAAVDGRRREIAMLRTIGFSRSSIVVAFLLESLLICVAACAFGLAASFVVLFKAARQDFLSDATWTVLAYELKATPDTVLTALALAILVAVIGALAPAVRASRTQVIEALRKA